MSLFFQDGVFDGSAIIAWADAMIVEMETPPDSLLELSTTASEKTADILSCLNRLSAGAEFWKAFGSVMPLLREYLSSHRDRAKNIATQLCLTASDFSGGDVPQDFRFVYRLEDAFSLAQEGMCGDPESVYQEFIHELERFIELA